MNTRYKKGAVRTYALNEVNVGWKSTINDDLVWAELPPTRVNLWKFGRGDISVRYKFFLLRGPLQRNHVIFFQVVVTNGS